MAEGKLSGKVALITGGARGLGRGYALRLASLGADIAIIDRNLNAAAVYEFERAQLTADTTGLTVRFEFLDRNGRRGQLYSLDAVSVALGNIRCPMAATSIGTATAIPSASGSHWCSSA